MSLEKDELYSNYKKNLKKQIRINSIIDDMSLPKILHENNLISVCGLNETKDNKKNWGKIKEHDIILFFTNRKFFSKGKVLYKTNNQKILSQISSIYPLFNKKKLLLFITELQLIDIDLQATIPIFVNPLMSDIYYFPIKQINKKNLNMLKKTFGSLEQSINFLGEPKNKYKSISDIIESKKLKNSVDFKIESSIKKQRIGQERFRKNILSNFRNRCAVCNNSQIDLLEAGHIIPIEDGKKSGLLKNGISFCVLCHKMFDKGYFSFDTDYRIIFSKQKKIDEVLKDLILENKKIGKCVVYPEQDYLSLHRIKFGIF